MMVETPKKTKIVERLKALAFSIAPGASLVGKYGGAKVESVLGQPKTEFCGGFAYTRRVSSEFADGTQL